MGEMRDIEEVEFMLFFNEDVKRTNSIRNMGGTIWTGIAIILLVLFGMRFMDGAIYDFFNILMFTVMLVTILDLYRMRELAKAERHNFRINWVLR